MKNRLPLGKLDLSRATIVPLLICTTLLLLPWFVFSPIKPTASGVAIATFIEDGITLFLFYKAHTVEFPFRRKRISEEAQILLTIAICLSAIALPFLRLAMVFGYEPQPTDYIGSFLILLGFQLALAGFIVLERYAYRRARKLDGGCLIAFIGAILTALMAVLASVAIPPFWIWPVAGLLFVTGLGEPLWSRSSARQHR